MASAIDLLKSNLPLLSDRDRNFGQDLVRQFIQKGQLSDRQWPWVETLNQRAQAAQQSPSKPIQVDVGNFQGVVALFAKAAEKLSAKKMKIRLQTESGQEVALFMPERGKYAGDVYVTNGASFTSGNSVFFGHVSRDGQFSPAARNTPEVTKLLQQLSTDPAGTASHYGKLTGHCCFCRKPLEDPRSLTVGYGPVCAGNYGLPWGEAEEVDFREPPKLGSRDPRFARYEELKDEYSLCVDSDDPEMLKPIVDELRSLERQLGITDSYHICGSVYD